MIRCFVCGQPVAEEDHLCMSCGADVRLYKKIYQLSNAYYNAGLYRAQVRDMTGAADCLKQSLKLNKYNIDARNLLGLVYYETGETVEALAQWVISTNFQPKKNIANNYLNEVQTNNTKLDLVDQTVKKYNQAVTYCRQGSDDMAIIQLKKVLSMNPKLVKGHQLLALLYMKQEDYGKAKKSLRKAQLIDSNNPKTLNYMREILLIERKHGIGGRKDENMTYKNGNELIIQPTESYRAYSPFYTVGTIVGGILVGAALMWFLVLPARTQSIRNELNKTTLEMGDQLSAKSATIDSLNKQIEDLQNQLESSQAKTEAQRSGVEMYDALLTARDEMNAGDYLTAKETLDKIDPDVLADKGRLLYNQVLQAVSPQALEQQYNRGVSQFNNRDYASAVTTFGGVLKSDESYKGGLALFYYARSLHGAGNKEEAVEQYKKYIEKYPDTFQASDSERYISELQN